MAHAPRASCSSSTTRRRIALMHARAARISSKSLRPTTTARTIGRIGATERSIPRGICGGSLSGCAVPRLDRDLDSAFAALSDSSRREMIRMLLHKPRRAGELAQGIAMSPQALSRHLRVLRKAGLVTEAGIEGGAGVRGCSVHPAAFQPVQLWLAQVEELWRGQLHAFKSYAESPQRGRKPKV